MFAIWPLTTVILRLFERAGAHACRECGCVFVTRDALHVHHIFRCRAKGSPC
jgi:hypothetical protein